MTSFTLRDLSNGEKKMLFFNSLDKLRVFLSNVSISSSKLKSSKVIYEEKEYEILGLSYDQNDDSIPLLQKSRLIPKEDDYGN